MFKIVDPDSSIYVELTVNGQTQVQEFPPHDERAFVVGSSARASLRVNGDGVSAVQFHLEREDGAIWLIPAYGVEDLSVDWMRVLGPTPLDVKSMIEFCQVRLHATITEADYLTADDDRLAVLEPDAQLNSESYARNVPGEEDPTVLAMHPFRASDPSATSVNADGTQSEVGEPVRPSIEPRWLLSDDDDTPCNVRLGTSAHRSASARRNAPRSGTRSRSNATRVLVIGGACVGALVVVLALCVAGRLRQHHQHADTQGPSTGVDSSHR